MIYGYCRVATKRKQDMAHLDRQAEEIKLMHNDADIICDIFTKSKGSSCILDDLIAKTKIGDTIIVTELDRLARSTEEVVRIIRELLLKNVNVHVLDIGLIKNDDQGRFFIKTLSAIIDMERAMVKERVSMGKLEAKSKPGFKEGRPKKFTPQQIDYALSLVMSGMSYRKAEDVTGISKSTLIRAMRNRKKKLGMI
jgi:DNA invertase Pin-like site-specific DNA recombinase